MVDGVSLSKKENVQTSAFKNTQENATIQVQKMEAMIVRDLLPNMRAVLKMIVQVRSTDHLQSCQQRGLQGSQA